MAANAALKVKAGEANRATKIAARRIAELEAEIQQLYQASAKVVLPTEPLLPVKPPRAPSTRRNKTIGPGDAVPPGVAVQEPEPIDAKVSAARAARKENLSGK